MHAVSHSSSCCRQLRAHTRVSSITRNSRQLTVCRLANDQAQRETKAKQPQTQEKNIFESIIGTLLSRGASRLERGVATCLDCRGTGYCNCPACKGAGVMGPVGRKAVREATLMRTPHASDKGDQWLTTNRCTQCRGSGSCTCGSCEGTGLRLPSLVNPSAADASNADSQRAE